MESAFGINYEILYGGSAFSMLRIQMRRGMSIKAQSDAMVTMDTTLKVEGKLEGGVLGGQEETTEVLHSKHRFV